MLFTPNFSKFVSLLLFSCYIRVAQKKLSSVLCTHGQIALESKSKTKQNRPIWRARWRCNCISQTDSMYCQVFSRHQGQGELQEGIWIRTINGSDRSLIGILFFFKHAEYESLSVWMIGRDRTEKLLTSVKVNRYSWVLMNTEGEVSKTT